MYVWMCVCESGGLPPLSRRVFDDEDGDDGGVCAALTVCVTPAFPVSDVETFVGKITPSLHRTVL